MMFRNSQTRSTCKEACRYIKQPKQGVAKPVTVAPVEGEGWRVTRAGSTGNSATFVTYCMGVMLTFLAG